MAFKPGYGKVDRDYGLRMATMEPESDGPVWMVNLMKYKEVASYSDGNPGGVSGKEADDRYAPTKILREIGADVPFFGDVVDQPVGDDVRWDRIGVVKYPTRRSFIEMQTRKDFMAKHEHKEAGMEFTFVIGCVPLDGLDAGTSRTNSVDGTPVSVLLEVLCLGEDAPNHDHVADADLMGQLGGTPRAWFTVEGTIMGDGRKWDAVRFTAFESLAAAGTAARHVSAERGHAVDAYSIVVQPSINTF